MTARRAARISIYFFAVIDCTRCCATPEREKLLHSYAPRCRPPITFCITFCILFRRHHQRGPTDPYHPSLSPLSLKHKRDHGGLHPHILLRPSPPCTTHGARALPPTILPTHRPALRAPEH
jgi:hypothetical protein